MRQSKFTIFFLILLAMGCSRAGEDSVEEDYDKLFPFGGIEKPKESYEDQIVQLGDPYASISDYVYPGVEIADNVRSYKVTLTCLFKEQGFTNNEDEVHSRYVINYVDTDKKLHTIASYRLAEGIDFLLMKNKEHVVTFNAKSGFPMYLRVNGVGPQNSSVHATISALSDDGFTIVNPLVVHEYQNREGIDKIKSPFCAYVILP